MSQYARVSEGSIVEMLELDDAWYQNLLASGNPKAQIFRIVVENPRPNYDPTTQVLEELLTIEPTRVVRGWTVRDKTAQEIADERRQVWTAYQFLQRFTEQELENIRQRTATDPVCWRFLTLATAAQEVYNDDPMTLIGMDYLVFSGLLTQQRRDEILSLV